MINAVALRKPNIKLTILLLVIAVMSSFSLALPVYADYFAGQDHSGYISVSSTSASNSDLVIGTTTANTYKSIGISGIVAPSIAALDATGITITSARLNATVVSDGSDSSVDVRFGIGIASHTAADFALYTYISDWLTGYHTNSVIYLDKTGLGMNTTYYYRVQVRNTYGTVTSVNEVTFTTTETIGNALNLIGAPSSTSIILTWKRATGSTNTIIRYRTDTYPTTPADGTSAYSGTGYQCTVSGLTPGQVYYFSAWGYANSESPVVANLAMSTLGVNIPSGGKATSTAPVIPVPTVPSSAAQEPSISGFNLEPFTTIINYFNNAPGGFGIPDKYAWETLFIIGIVLLGFGIYIKTRVFLLAFAVVFLLSCGGVSLHLVQGYLLAFEAIVGLGIWAVERYMQ